jgi:hypothetical protein
MIGFIILWLTKTVTDEGKLTITCIINPVAQNLELIESKIVFDS